MGSDRQRKWKAGEMCIRIYSVCRWFQYPRPPHPPCQRGWRGLCGVWECAGHSRQRQRNPVIRWADFLWLDLSWTNASSGSNPSSLRLMGFLNGLVSQRYPNWVCFILLIHLQTHFTAHVNNNDESNQLIIQSRRGQNELLNVFIFCAVWPFKPIIWCSSHNDNVPWETEINHRLESVMHLQRI